MVNTPTVPALGSWVDARNILCIRLDSLGDVLMTTPAIRALKEWGGTKGVRRITLLTSAAGGAIARLIPTVDDVLTYEAPWVKGSGAEANHGGVAVMARLLQARAFDAAVIFTVFSQSAFPAAMLAYMAEIPLRLAHVRERAYQLLTHEVRESEPQGGIRHEVERQLALVATVGASARDGRLSLAVPDAARGAMRERLSRLGAQRGWDLVIVHPGASAASRRYPPPRFGEAARQIAARTGARVVVTGSDSERAIAEQVVAHAGGCARSLAGELALDELVALVAEASLVVTNNTGPAHIAAAVGTPVVTLYALTNPQHTPWMVPSRVLSYDVPCRWCYRSVCPEGHNHCLTMVAPSDVAAAAVALLAEGRGSVATGTSPDAVSPFAATAM